MTVMRCDEDKLVKSLTSFHYLFTHIDIHINVPTYIGMNVILKMKVRDLPLVVFGCWTKNKTDIIHDQIILI